MQRAIKTARSLVSARPSVCSEEIHSEHFFLLVARRRGGGKGGGESSSRRSGGRGESNMCICFAVSFVLH